MATKEKKKKLMCESCTIQSVQLLIVNANTDFMGKKHGMAKVEFVVMVLALFT